MKYINLTKRKKAIVDDDMFDYLNQFPWHFSTWGYAQRSVYVKGSGRKNQKNIHISMQNMVIECPKGFQIDHINRNKLDNRKVNLRIATIAQNRANRAMCKNNKTGFKGVHFDKSYGRIKRYKATITVNKKTVNLGRYLTAEEASFAYKDAARKYQGNFANI